MNYLSKTKEVGVRGNCKNIGHRMASANYIFACVDCAVSLNNGTRSCHADGLAALFEFLEKNGTDFTKIDGDKK